MNMLHVELSIVGLFFRTADFKALITFLKSKKKKMQSFYFAIWYCSVARFSENEYYSDNVGVLIVLFSTSAKANKCKTLNSNF